MTNTRPRDYSKGKIYKLYSIEDESLFYIGSTTKQYLSQRLCKHVSDYNRYLKNKCNYISSIKIIETGNYKIELLEAFPCNSKDELLAREGHYIRQNPECVNKKIEGRTRKQYLEDNKEHLKKKAREWQEKNQEKIKEYREKFNEIKKTRTYKCECGSECRRYSKQRHFRTAKHKKWEESQPKN